MAGQAASKSTILFGKAPWWVLVLEGLGLVVLGLAAVVAPFIASLAVTLIVGWIYLFAGGIRMVSSLTHRGPSWGWSLAIALLALAVGALVLLRPFAGLVSLTVLLAAYFCADAVFSFVLAATVGRHTGRAVWLILSGIADLVLGGVVVLGVLAGAFWLLGFVVAANLVFAGAGLLTLGVTWRARQAMAAADLRDAAHAKA